MNTGRPDRSDEMIPARGMRWGWWLLVVHTQWRLGFFVNLIFTRKNGHPIKFQLSFFRTQPENNSVKRSVF